LKVSKKLPVHKEINGSNLGQFILENDTWQNLVTLKLTTQVWLDCVRDSKIGSENGLEFGQGDRMIL
jgi:hypothetical protein